MGIFEAASERFFAAHHTDPRPRDHPDHCARYHQCMVEWLDHLAPDASEAMRLAARCQHIRRWELPRDQFPLGRTGYKRWRSQLALFHVERAREVLAEVGYDEATIKRVGELLMKKGLRTDPQVQIFEDAICLVFLQTRLTRFVEEWPEEKVVDVVRKTWAKMGGAGQEAAAELLGSLPERPRALVLQAIS